MPKYLVHCDTNWCGTNEDFIVEANDEDEAAEKAQAHWEEEAQLSSYVTREIDESDEEFDWYTEIT